jgi:hypothetical protein
LHNQLTERNPVSYREQHLPFFNEADWYYAMQKGGIVAVNQ